METPASHAAATRVPSLTDLCTDLTQKTADGALEPVVRRDLELEAMIEVLSKKERRNPMLLGEHGAGKTAIVEALAQRIVEGKVPVVLADMRVLAVSSEVLSAWAPNRERFKDLAKVLGTVANSVNLILFVDGLRGTAGAPGKAPGQGLAGVLEFAMHETEVRCIGAGSEKQYEAACAAYPGLDKVFRILHVRPLDAAGAKLRTSAEPGEITE